MKSLEEKMENLYRIAETSIDELRENCERDKEDLEIQILNEIENLNRVIYDYSEDGLKKAKSYVDSGIGKLAETKA